MKNINSHSLIKRVISLCMAVTLLFAMLPQIMLPVEAASSGICGKNLIWSLDSGTLTISGTGEMYDFESRSDAPWYQYRKSINDLVIGSGVTSIGSCAFVELEKLTTIDIPSSVTRLGGLAIYLCHNIKSLTIPSSITDMAYDAIYACYGIETITIPNSVADFSSSDFSSCDSLSYIYISGEDGKYCDIDGVVYDKEITTLVCCPPGRTNISIPNTVTHIGAGAFDSCLNLGEIVLPEGITTIEQHAFVFMYKPTSLVIPSTVTYIDEEAFFADPNFTFIDVADNNIFYCDIEGILYDKNLTRLIYCPTNKSNVTIPDSVTEISAYAFDSCEITHIDIPDSVTKIGDEAFQGCEYLTEISIPQSVINMGRGLFYGCDNLSSISIECSPEVLDSELFRFCRAITNFEIPNTVTTINFGVFSYCENMTSIIIPASVTSIDSCAFQECISLTDVFYCGSQEQWGNISIEDDGYNDYLLNATIHYNYRPLSSSFSTVNAGWSFANSSFSFREDSESPFSTYYIPEERYDEVFGTAYLASNKFSKKWGGNCAGMSTAAILFFLDYLDWKTIDDGYPNNFSTPNSFYQTINYHYASQSGYAAIGNDTEVTRLIEAYQLYINEIDRSEYEALLDDTYHAGEFKKDGIFSYYTQEHLSNGNYISSMLEVFSKAYEENTPLYISLKGDDFSHAIVSRTDKKPVDMGNGWWRVYVYDPNKPYLNDSIAEEFWEAYPDAGLKDACNDLAEDVYIELNPSLNLWRYCTSVNSDSSSKYLGCNLNNEVLYIKCDAKDGDGNKLTVKIPEYFYTIDLNDIQISDYVHPTTTAWMPESTEDGCIISIDGSSDCLVYSSFGDLIAVVENGEAVILIGSGYYAGYMGEAEESTPAGGKLYLPSDTYTIQYTSGQMSFLGNSNVISISGETAMNLTVDVIENSVQILATDDGAVSIKCANLISADECSYIETEGNLVAGESFSVCYSDNGKVEASTDSKDGEFKLYQKDADQEEASATKVIKSNSLRWLWIVGGAVIIGIAVLFILMKRKKNK